MKIEHWKIPVIYKGIPKEAFYFNCKNYTETKAREIAGIEFARQFGEGWSLGETTKQFKEV